MGTQISELTSDLLTLTAEINAYKSIAGRAIYEAGRRLKHVKENDLARGQWECWCRDEVKMTPQHANRFIRVYDRFSDRTSMFELGVASLDLLVEFTDEQLERPHTVPSTGATKTVDEMTVRELREVKAALKAEREAREQAEARAQKAEDDYETVRDTLESISEQPPRVEYVYVDNTASDPMKVTSDVLINGNVQRLSEAVGAVLEDFGFFQYYDRQIQALGERSREELENVVDALERFTHSLKRALNGSVDVIEI